MQAIYDETYRFTWSDLGDIATGRPNLGGEVPVAMYRLSQYTMREALERRFGNEAAKVLLREAGWIAGREFYRNVLPPAADFPAFVANLQEALKAQKIGILRLEKADLERYSFVLTVSEDLDCSGLPVSGTTVCDYDEGFIAGVFHAFTGQHFQAEEVDCWATGDRTCRFEVRKDSVGA